MFNRAFQLLRVDPALGGILCVAFRPELPDLLGGARRLGPQSQLTVHKTPWGNHPGALDAPGIVTADLDLLQAEAQASLAQRLDAGGLSLVAWCHNPPWVHLADRLAFLVLPTLSRPAYAPGRRIALNQAIGLITSAAASLAVEGHRAEVLALRAAHAIAATAGRQHLCEGDLAEAIDLVLAPRARAAAMPESQPGTPAETSRPDDTSDSRVDQTSPSQSKPHSPPQASAPAPVLPSPMPVAPLPTVRHRLRPTLHGAPVRTVPSRRRQGSLSLTATMLAALPWQRLRGHTGLPPAIRPSDLRRTLRRPRQGRLVIFVVDGSGSVGPRRLGQAKGAIMHLLQQAYRSRDQVALIIAAGPEAHVLLPPARAVEQARRKLLKLPAGGATPLAGALLLAHRLASSAAQRDDRPSILLVLTDGRANQAHRPIPDTTDRKQALRTELRQAALLLRKQAVPAVVLGEPSAESKVLAHWLGATFSSLSRGLGAATRP